MAKPTLIRRNTSQDQDAMRQALGNPAAATIKNVEISGAAVLIASVNYEVGQSYKVPLYQLQKSENNARVFYSAEELDEMSKSLSEKGQDIPAIGYLKEGRVIVIDGQKRFQAATNAGISTLTVLIVEPPADEGAEYEESRRINLYRSTQTALDDAVRWQSLMKKGVYTSQDELADRLGVSKSNISKTLGITRIPERLLRMMSDHPQTRAMSIAYEISNIFSAQGFDDSPEKAANLAQEVIEETIKKDLGRNQVKSLIDSRLQGPKSRVRGMSAVIAYGDSKGTLKIFPARGQIDLSFKGLPEHKVDELRTRIEQMLAGQLSI